MLWSLVNAPDTLTAINAAINRGSIDPQGPQERYEFSLLLHQACTDAISPPMLVQLVVPEGFCGSAPVLAVDWVVAPNAASTSIPPTRPMWAPPDGVKALTERATVGYSCDCTTVVQKGAQTLCLLRAEMTLPKMLRDHLAAQAMRKAILSQPGRVKEDHPAKVLKRALQSVNVKPRGKRRGKPCATQTEPNRSPGLAQ
jgi:hypothetical protein